jgi:hypothetical protein
MDKNMFLKITENIKSKSIITKENTLISELGLLPSEINSYFKKIPIKRNTAYVEMKKIISRKIIQVHNEKYKDKKYLKYKLQEIAKLVELDNHSTILHYLKYEKFDDKLASFIRENFVNWIKNKQYPLPYKNLICQIDYIIVNEDELDVIKLTKDYKITKKTFDYYIDIKQRQFFIN